MCKMICSMCGNRVKNLEIGRCSSVDPPLCQFAVITWANEGNHSSTPTGHCRCFAPLVRFQTSQPCSQCGKSRVKSRPPFPAQWPRRCLSHCLSHWSGFCLVTFPPSPPSLDQQLNPLHQIFSFPLNNGHSHINTRGFFHSARSQRWPYHPGVLCLFVPQLKELNWAAVEGGPAVLRVIMKGHW